MIIENTLAFVERLHKSEDTPKTVKSILDKFINNRKTGGLKLFMIICAIMGASFMSAGIFAIISHNWDDFPKHLRGVLSFVPALVALYFYYQTLFKHKESIVWKEASGLFLFFMIGASIAMVAQTYQMDGDFKKFTLVWLVLSTPIIYISRTSSIIPFYLGLAGVFLTPDIYWSFFFPTGYGPNEDLYIFWIFFAAVIPHVIMVFNKNGKQGVRSIFLSYYLAIYLTLSLPLIFPGGIAYWYLILIVGFYFLSRKYFVGNSLRQRPFDLALYFILGAGLLTLSAAPEFAGSTYAFLEEEPLWRLEDYDGEKLLFNILALVGFLAIVVVSILKFRKKTGYSKHILALPLIVLFQLILLNVEHYLDFDMMWVGDWLFYLYVIGFSVHCLSEGGKNARYPKIIYGLILISLFLWFRYADTEMGFIMKGLTFMMAGAFFFLLNFIAKDDLDRIEEEMEVETTTSNDELDER